jgi:FkbM family methyltransferase
MFSDFRRMIASLYIRAGQKLSLNGAKHLGFSENGNAILSLNKSSSLGRKGTTIELPKDNVIYKSVLMNGNWELQEAYFLAANLKTLGSDLRVAFLDIGANVGLMALQVNNLVNSKFDSLLYEPIPRHIDAIRNNIIDSERVCIFNAGLSDSNGNAVIFTQVNNHGNSSTYENAMPNPSISDVVSTEIRLLDTKEVCFDLNAKYDAFVVKSDTQGMDALILSQFSNQIWQKVHAAVIEVWAIDEVEKNHVSKFLREIQDSHKLKWQPELECVDPNEVKDFWLGKNGQQRNLFLEKR